MKKVWGVGRIFLLLLVFDFSFLQLVFLYVVNK